MRRLLLPLILLPVTIYAQQWEQVFPFWNSSDIECLVQWNGDTLFAAGRNFSLWRSGDAGETWDEVNIGKLSVDIYSINRYKDGLLLVPAPDAVDPTRTQYSFYRYHPATGNVSEIVLESNPLYQGGMWYVSVTVAGDWIYAHAGNDYPYFGTWYRTSDDGATWLADKVQVDNSGQMAFHFDDPAHGWMMARNYNRVDSVYQFATNDSGKNWAKAIQIALHGTSNGIHSVGSGSARVLSAGNTSGIYVSRDSGATWAAAASIDWDGSEYLDHAFLPSGRGYAFARDGKMFESTDFGQSWQRFQTGSIEQISMARCNATLFVEAAAGNYILRGWTGGQMDAGLAGQSLSKRFQNPFANINRDHFYDANHGVLFASRWDAMGSANHVFETSDGGVTWDYLHEMVPPKTAKILMPASGAWYAAESWSAGAYRIRRSKDYGLTWETLVQWDAGTPETGYNMYALDAARLYVKSKEGTNVSTDAGATWEFYPDNDAALQDGRENPYTELQQSFFMHDQSTGYILSSKRLYKTMNGCRDWTEVRDMSDIMDDGREFHVLSPDTLALNLYSDLDSLGRVTKYYLSTNGGVSWSANADFAGTGEAYFNRLGNGYGIRSSMVYPIRRLQADYSEQVTFSARGTAGLNFVSSGRGWYILGNTIYRTTDKAVTPVEELPGVTNNYEITSIYPNPVSPGGRVIMEVRAGNGVNLPIELAVYDMLGREVAVLYRGDSAEGAWQVSWQLPAGIPAGLYTVKLCAGATQYAKQLVIVR